MEKIIRKLNAEQKDLYKEQNLLLSNRANLPDNEFRKQLYENNRKLIGLLEKILDYHQRRKIECADGVPMEYLKELLDDPIVIEKFSVLRREMAAKGEEEYYEYEWSYLHDAFLTLVFIAGFDLSDLEPLPPEGIIKLYIDGQDPENNGKNPDLSKYR